MSARRIWKVVALCSHVPICTQIYAGGHPNRGALSSRLDLRLCLELLV